MRASDESAIQRRRGADIRSTYDASFQSPTSAVSSQFYLITIGDGPFPTTGLNTVFMAQLVDEIPPTDTEGSLVAPTASGEKFPIINLGEGVPIQDETVVRGDQYDGQLFCTYRGNGAV